jgi:AraC-like DNA-binding protein
MPALPPAHVDLWSDRALVLAPLGSVGRHAHAAMALLIGIDGEFAIRWRGDWRRTRCAFIPAGVAHELECERTLMATLYLFPLTGEPEALARQLGIDPRRTSVDVQLGADVEASLLAIHGGDHERPAVRAWLDQLVGPVDRASVDPRIFATATLLREHAADKLALAELAERIGVSESRLMHLFKAGVGVPIRRFRLWERMRLLTEHVAAGDSLTMAALAAGFADSAHLSHGFRGMFGIPPSPILNAASRLRAR